MECRRITETLDNDDDDDDDDDDFVDEEETALHNKDFITIVSKSRPLYFSTCFFNAWIISASNLSRNKTFALLKVVYSILLCFTPRPD